jgi:N-acetylmuramoyl-L-alanine amidase
LKIYIAPSSQPHNAYAGTSTNEQRQCTRIAHEAAEALRRNGYTVKVSTEGLSNVSKIKQSNEWGADIHLPIHTNAGGGKGSEVLCHSSRTSNKYVVQLAAALAGIVPSGVNRGIKPRNDLAEIASTNAICVYPEIEFHDRSDYAAWIINNVELIGETIAKAFCKADGKQYIAPGTTAPDLGYTVLNGIKLKILDLSRADQQSVTGEDVDLMQGLLMAHGYGPDGLTGNSGRPDGSAGAQTRKHLGNFQQSKNIDVDHICGAQTWNKLLSQ